MLLRQFEISYPLSPARMKRIVLAMETKGLKKIVQNRLEQKTLQLIRQLIKYVTDHLARSRVTDHKRAILVIVVRHKEDDRALVIAISADPLDRLVAV